MNNYNIVEKGIIVLGEKVMVSDPCYGLETWCQGVIENVLRGEYVCKVGYSDEDEYGTRVADIEVIHKSFSGKFLEYYPEEFEVGVDSGQAGIFDYEYYKKYHKDRNEHKHVDEHWYARVCGITYTRKKNPYYKEFNDWGDKEFFKKYAEYMHNTKINSPYLEKLDGNIIDNLGIVSSSGYGDGGYVCWTAHSNEGKVVGIRVEFITEDEDDE